MTSIANDNSFSLRIVECLRSGVPGRSVVTTLGTNQNRVVEVFEKSLATSSTNGDRTGFSIEAPFGCGKSHVLSCLREISLENNFACSIVCVSKEMSLASITQLFPSAIRELRLPGKTVGGSCAEFLDRISFNGQAWAELLRHYSNDDEPIDAIFGATLQLFERYQSQSDVLDALIDFWDGDRCPMSDIKWNLKAIGLDHAHLRVPTESRMGLARLQFVTNLLVAAGYAGWAILLDEGEMIAKLSYASRVKAYANLAALLGSPDLAHVRRLVSVLAITNDLWHVLLTERGDREKIDAYMRYQNPQLAEIALRSIDYLYDTARRLELQPMALEQLEAVKVKLADVYGNAYPEAKLLGFDNALREGDASRSVRSFLKEWITDWDLRRLYPDHTPTLSERHLQEDLSESADYADVESE